METKPWLQHYDHAVPPHILVPPVALPYFLAQSAQNYPDRPCTIFEGVVVTFAAMQRVSNQLARGLVALGLTAGERVGIRISNLPQYVASFFAVLKAGGVVVALNPQYTAEETIHLLNETGAVLLIGLREDEPLVETVRSRTQVRAFLLTSWDEARHDSQSFLQPDKGVVWNAGWHNDRSALDLRNISAFPGADHAVLPEVNPDDPAVFQYTGGTTGTPKAAIGLHRNLVANTLQFKTWLGGREENHEWLLTAIPMTHVYGMVLGMSLGTALAASLVLVPNPRDLGVLVDTIERYVVTLFPGVPAIYNALVRYKGLIDAPDRIRSLRVCISGSAPLPSDTQRRFESFISGRLVEGYGLSEAPTATHCNPIQRDNRIGSIGLPLPDVDCRIVSLVDGVTDVVTGEVGELLIRGPQVMAGYHQMPAETAEVFSGGWLHTGDIARMDADGYFYIVDRKKEVIKVGGLQVWPREIEDTLIAHPKILDAGVVGIIDEIRGEVPKAWVVLRPGEQLSVPEIQAWCAQTLAHFKIPTEVAFIEQLPRSPVGKLLRRELRRWHLEG